MSFFSIAGIGREELSRIREISVVMAGYGFGEIVAHLPFPGRLILPKASKEHADKAHPERLRLALEEMGPAYIKLGQFLSTRADLIPSEYIEEFKKLRDQTEPLVFEEIEEVLIEEWGDTYRDSFALILEKPIGTASIAQVHKARLADGREVALKILRPGVRAQISGDIGIIMFLARFLQKRFEGLRFLRPVELAEEFARNLRRETDFKREAIIIKKIKKNSRYMSERLLIPGVFAELSTDRIIVMEYVDGLPLESINIAASEKRRLARLISEIMVRQILDDGLFHADPHPGNMLYTSDCRLSYLDFGMIGRLSPKMKNELIDLLIAAGSSQPEMILQQVLFLGDVQKEVDKETLVREIMEIADRHLTVTLEEISIGRALYDIFDLIRRHEITVHPAYTVVARAIMNAEETVRKLDPSINILEEMSGTLRKLFFKRYSPGYISSNARMLSKDIYRFLSDMPAQMGHIMRKLKTGQLEIEFRHVGLEDMMRTLDRVSNRIAFSLVIAALIIGSSLIIATESGPTIFGIHTFGFIGYLLAVFFGFWLLFSILRKRKY